MRKFSLVHTDSGDCVGEFLSQTPRGAALKATTKGNTGIFFLIEVDTGHLHAFEGALETLTDEEQTVFTRAHNIVNKPTVRKIAYDRGSKEWSRDNVLHRVNRMCGSECNKDFGGV